MKIPLLLRVAANFSYLCARGKGTRAERGLEVSESLGVVALIFRPFCSTRSLMDFRNTSSSGHALLPLSPLSSCLEAIQNRDRETSDKPLLAPRFSLAFIGPRDAKMLRTRLQSIGWRFWMPR